ASNGRGTVTNDSVDALAGTPQLTTTVAPYGRSSISEPPAAPSDSVRPLLMSTRWPAAGGEPLIASSLGSAGTATSPTGSSESADSRLTCSGSALTGCGAASPTTPATTPATSG